MAKRTLIAMAVAGLVCANVPPPRQPFDFWQLQKNRIPQARVNKRQHYSRGKKCRNF